MAKRAIVNVSPGPMQSVSRREADAGPSDGLGSVDQATVQVQILLSTPICLNRLNGLWENEWYKLFLISSVSRTPDNNPAVWVQVPLEIKSFK